MAGRAGIRLADTGRVKVGARLLLSAALAASVAACTHSHSTGAPDGGGGGTGGPPNVCGERGDDLPRFKTDTHTVVTIGGKSYDAWMTGIGQSTWLSLVAQ